MKRAGMPFSVVAAIALALAVSLAAPSAWGQVPEKRAVSIAVGGKAALYYLPLTLAERLGYFKEAGLEVQILDFAGGAKALQAMMGGSADVVAGGYDHVVILRARGQKLRSFVLQVATPSLMLGVAKARAAGYRSARDLKGMKVGVTAPGSSTHIFLNHLLASAGLSPDDVAVIGVGTGPTAVAAVRAGHIDAIANVEPAITMLERSGAIVVMAETVSEKGSRALFGEALPAGSLYTREEFLKQYPNTAQALVNAMVRALLWLDKASAEQILRTVPAEYTLGQRDVYLAALERQRQGFSKDGLIPPAGAAALYRVLQRFDESVQGARNLDITQTYDNRFVEQALRTYRK